MYANDDRDAFIQEIYIKYSKKLENICFSKTHYHSEFRPMIAEVIQSTFQTAAENYEDIKDHAAIEGWLIVTCAHRLDTALEKHYRRAKRHAFSVDQACRSPLPSEKIDFVEEWLETESRRKLLDAIRNCLNEREKDVFADYFLLEKSAKEIASEYDATESAVKSMISRIRKKANKYEKKDIFFLTIASFLVYARLLR